MACDRVSQLCAQIVSESLRLSPGIEHLRLVTTRTVRVGASVGASAGASARGGRLLPAGTTLVVSPSSLHRHPRYWPPPCDGAPPRPEFFTRAAQAARPTGCYLPFSAGAKGCPAARFATHEMRLLLVRVLQRFELRLDSAGAVCLDRRKPAD